MSEAVTLYRPVGQKELDLIADSGFAEFPPRLPRQPIFYPVMNKEYATQIARDWNAKYNGGGVGYVTRFGIRRAFIDNYEIKIVGGQHHEEYWIPSEDLKHFNRNIVGKIEVISKFENSR
jgi:hypothetical protein